MVSPGVFRSGFPTHHHVPFLHRLGLRSIVNLAQEPGLAHKGELKDWVSRQGIAVITCDTIPSREPFEVPADEEIGKALRVLLDPSAQPVLVHSIRGDGPLSVVIGILRRTQQWALTAIFDEARRFSATGVSLLDLQTIETFDVDAALEAPRSGGPATDLVHFPAGASSADEAPAARSGDEAPAATAAVESVAPLAVQ